MGDTERSTGGGTDGEPPFRSLGRLGYDDERRLYRASYDPASGGGLLVDLVLAVAEVLDAAPTEIEQAHRAFDVEAFEGWVAEAVSGGSDGQPFGFRLDDCLVNVTAHEVTFERLK
jgi:hypothetical protein